MAKANVPTDVTSAQHDLKAYATPAARAVEAFQKAPNAPKILVDCLHVALDSDALVLCLPRSTALLSKAEHVTELALTATFEFLNRWEHDEKADSSSTAIDDLLDDADNLYM
jgi:hypothetical protein